TRGGSSSLRPRGQVKLTSELGDGQASVADGILLFVRQLRHRAPVRKQEDGIVAEAAPPAGVPGDAPLAAAEEDLAGRSARAHEADDTDKGGAAVSAALHLLQQQLVAFRCAEARPPKARRLDPWATAQRHHGEAGIIGQRRQTRRVRVCPRLLLGVGQERGAVLLDLGPWYARGHGGGGDRK